MIVYNPLDGPLIKERIIEADRILSQINAKYCFISGSFLFKKDYADIDMFVVTRKKIKSPDKKINITTIDFNDTCSLFYHSISKSCIAKNILPNKPLKVTLSDYWQVINEAVPTIFNQKERYHKNIRFLILYTEYFKTGNILDTHELNQFISKMKDYKKILEYIKKEVPKAINKHSEKSYIKRYFYTQAGYYKDSLEYESQNFLYKLAHSVARGVYGES